MATSILSQPLHLSRSEIGRLFSKVQANSETGCWNWMGGKTNDGHGTFWFRGQKVLTHRFVYAWLEEPLPPPSEQELHHICENPSCVNPSHLELIDHRTHMLKTPSVVTTVNATKTHCPQCGGEYEHEANGTRYCPACKQETNRKLYQAKRQEILDQKKTYHQANRKKILDRQKAYYQSNCEKKRAYNKAYYQSNCERIKARERDRYYAKKRDQSL